MAKFLIINRHSGEHVPNTAYQFEGAALVCSKKFADLFGLTEPKDHRDRSRRVLLTWQVLATENDKPRAWDSHEGTWRIIEVESHPSEYHYAY